MNKLNLVIFVILLVFSTSLPAQKGHQLKEILGPMPEKIPLEIDTLETVRIGNGLRHKLKWLAEDSDPIFHTPKDYMFAYIFVPDKAKTQKLPGMVAIHQDGAHNYLGYLEPAGIAGDEDQRYGIELYQRDYIVICPLRFMHGERRRITKPDTLADVFEEAGKAEQHHLDQLLLRGRNMTGKETFDLILATDVLYNTPGLNKERIGAIGHWRAAICWRTLCLPTNA